MQLSETWITEFENMKVNTIALMCCVSFLIPLTASSVKFRKGSNCCSKHKDDNAEILEALHSVPTCFVFCEIKGNKQRASIQIVSKKNFQTSRFKRQFSRSSNFTNMDNVYVWKLWVTEELTSGLINR